jgi:hypothetical protein
MFYRESNLKFKEIINKMLIKKLNLIKKRK